MKTVRNGMLAVFFTLLAITITTAQMRTKSSAGRAEGPPPPPSPEQVDEMIQDLVGELSLDKVRAAAFSDAFKKHMDMVRELREKSEQRDRTQMDALKKTFDSELEQILTPAQWEKFHAIHPPEKRGSGPGGKPGQRPGRGQPDRE